ncbi:MAG: hypothetical protein WAX69_14450 [Victivallales bacterium]
MKRLLVIILLVIAFMGAGVPRAKAMDPVTIGILAPIVLPYAIPIAESAARYALKGLLNAGTGMVFIFQDMLDVFMLPVGFLEVTIGLPFGLLSYGLQNIWTGGAAPFKLGFHAFMLVPRLFCLYQ